VNYFIKRSALPFVKEVSDGIYHTKSGLNM